MFSSINLDWLPLKVYIVSFNSELIDRPILKVRLWEEAQQFEFRSKIGGTGVNEMPNWGTENWQNVKLFAIRRLKIKGLF